MEVLARISPNFPLRPAAQKLERIFVVLLTIAAVWRLWLILSRFTMIAWNDVRLIPAFMLAHGEPLYSLPGHGVITTWMYGPLPLLFYLPVTAMPTITSALLAAGIMNLFIGISAIVIGCTFWPADSASKADRWLAAVLITLLWPESSFRYIQADNAAILLGVIASVVLLHKRASQGTVGADWVAAGCAAACVACKQIHVGPLVALVVWRYSADGPKAASEFLARGLLALAAIVLVCCIAFDPRGLWFVLVEIPHRLPWRDDWVERLKGLSVPLTVTVVLPALVLAGWRAHWWKRRSPSSLVALTWLCTLPAGLLGALKIGGSINSFIGFQILLPAMVLTLLTQHRLRPWLLGLVAIGAAWQAWPPTGAPLYPVLQPARDAVAIARMHPDEMWFPWHPLVSWYAEHRFYHSEDGMYVRFITGHPTTFQEVRRRLPPNFSHLAMPHGFSDWGLATSLIPPGASSANYGAWQVYSWVNESSRKSQ